MPSTRSKGNDPAQSQQSPIQNTSTTSKQSDNNQSKAKAILVDKDCNNNLAESTKVVETAPSSSSNGGTKLGRQTPKPGNGAGSMNKDAGNGDDGDNGQTVVVASSKAAGYAVPASENAAPVSSPTLQDSNAVTAKVQGPSPTQTTYGGRPRRQAAISGAARISKVNQELQKPEDDDFDNYPETKTKQPRADPEAEGTIICRETGAADAGPIKLKVKLVPEKVVLGTLEEDEEDAMSSPVELDDDRDEDFQIDKDDTEDDDDGVMEGDDGVSELEEMHGKGRKRTPIAKKGKGQHEKPLKNTPNTTRKGSQPPARPLDLKEAKAPAKGDMAKDAQSVEVAPEVLPAKSNASFTPELIQAILPPECRENDLVSNDDNRSPQMSTVAEGNHAQSPIMIAENSTSNGIEGAVIKPKAEVLDLSQPTAHRSLSVIPYSEDDEPLLSGCSKRRANMQASGPKTKRPRPAPKKQRAGGPSGGGPSETKFRRKEIEAMLQVITKDIKWKEVQRAVGNDKRTSGSYSSHWKNVLIKNILERYQD